MRAISVGGIRLDVTDKSNSEVAQMIRGAVADWHRQRAQEMPPDVVILNGFEYRLDDSQFGEPAPAPAAVESRPSFRQRLGRFIAGGSK